MSIITYSDFKAGQQIASLSNSGVRENLQEFIDEYEPKFLKSLLGLALYTEFIAAINTDDEIDTKWTDLEAMVKPMIICYVYYWYTRNEVTLTSGTGEVKPSNENSVPASSVNKQVAAWNKMVVLVREFNLDLSVYPSWIGGWNVWIYNQWCNAADKEIYYPINSLNL